MLLRRLVGDEELVFTRPLELVQAEREVGKERLTEIEVMEEIMRGNGKELEEEEEFM